MLGWMEGFTQAELDDAQARYGIVFPSDLIAVLLERQPVGGYDWAAENDEIRKMLNWPFEALLFDVENGFWWPDWGERPEGAPDRADRLRDALANAPRLIPLWSHRFIPETPALAGNPVFSMHGFDTIYYGANLTEYFDYEAKGRHEIGPVRHIPFWSDLVEKPDLGYEYYWNARNEKC